MDQQEAAGRRSDEAIKLDVISNLRWDGRVDASSIGTEVREGRVRLHGTVPNFTARAAARTITQMTPGVREVQEDLEVKLREAGPGADDETLEERAKTMLDWHSDLKGTDLEVRVHDGILTLEGTVAEHWKSDRAEKLLEAIRGIVDVKNNAAVVPTDIIADEALAEEVTGALARNVLIDEGSLEVQVRNGVVTLRGQVTSWLEAATVRDVVAATPGIRDIREDYEVAMDQGSS